MLYIVPNSWLRASFSKDSAKDQFCTVNQYLWNSYKGDMQQATDSIILTIFYDILNDIHLAQQTMLNYRFLKHNAADFCTEAQHDEKHYIISSMIDKLEDLGLWEYCSILKHQKPNHALGKGWITTPEHLQWVSQKSNAIKFKAIYKYNTIDDSMLHVIGEQAEVSILEQGSNRDRLRLFMQRHKLEFDEDHQTSFIKNRCINNIISILNIHDDAIEVKNLIQLIAQACPYELTKKMQQYPKAFATKEQLISFSKDYSQGWLEQLFSIKPEDECLLSINTAKKCLQDLKQLLKYENNPIWEEWMKLFISCKIVKNSRKAKEWWQIVTAFSKITSLSKKISSNIQICKAPQAFFSKNTVLFIPEELEIANIKIPDLNTFLHLRISSYYIKQQQLIKSIHRKLLNKALPIEHKTHIFPSTWIEREEDKLETKFAKKISFIKTIQNYTLCPRYAWIKEHLDCQTTSITLDFNAAILGQIIHEWMNNINIEPEEFVNKWLLKKQLKDINTKHLASLLNNIKQNWQALLSQYPWMLKAEYETQHTLQLCGYTGDLRIDLIIHHPKGLIILDFKTSKPQLKLLETHIGLAPQLALYWLTQKKEVIAIGYIHIKNDMISCCGFSCEEIGLLKQTHTKQQWQQLRQQWERELGNIMQKLSHNTDKQPFEPHHSCQTCEVKKLCQPE